MSSLLNADWSLTSKAPTGNLVRRDGAGSLRAVAGNWDQLGGQSVGGASSLEEELSLLLLKPDMELTLALVTTHSDVRLTS